MRPHSKNKVTDAAILRLLWTRSGAWIERMESVDAFDMKKPIESVKEFRAILKPMMLQAQKKHHPIASAKKVDSMSMEEILDEAQITNPESRQQLTSFMEDIYKEFHTTHLDFRRRAQDAVAVRMKRVVAAVLCEMNLNAKQIALLTASNIVTAYKRIADYGDASSDFKKDYLYYTNKYRRYYEEQQR